MTAEEFRAWVEAVLTEWEVPFAARPGPTEVTHFYAVMVPYDRGPFLALRLEERRTREGIDEWGIKPSYDRGYDLFRDDPQFFGCLIFEVCRTGSG
ncbi:MAG: hypothetical protein HYY85_21900 [Deltaproteobacteria bacterium]|nr:hypothetical protein [Deltaproteobacteria bacterium]